MKQVPASQPADATVGVDPFEQAASQYEQYIELVAIAQATPSPPSSFPEFYAPLPGPLTLTTS